MRIAQQCAEELARSPSSQFVAPLGARLDPPALQENAPDFVDAVGTTSTPHQPENAQAVSNEVAAQRRLRSSACEVLWTIHH